MRTKKWHTKDTWKCQWCSYYSWNRPTAIWNLLFFQDNKAKKKVNGEVIYRYTKTVSFSTHGWVTKRHNSVNTYVFFPVALFHLLTKKQKKKSTMTSNQPGNGSRNTSDDFFKDTQDCKNVDTSKSVYSEWWDLAALCLHIYIW